VGVEFAMVAGEASGDLLAAHLLSALKDRFLDMTAHGIGGSRMQAEGFRADWSSQRLAVRGYAEVLSHLPELLLLRRRLAEQLLRQRPSAFIGVDAPDFNLGLETRLKQHGIPVLHFVSPSVWAWRRERIETIRRAVDHMLVLFPFEEALYQEAGIEATYVGHPLADIIPLSPDRAAARAALGVADDASVVALMPGSRLAEIHYNAPTFLAAAASLRRERPRLVMLAPMASVDARKRFERLLEQNALPTDAVRLLDQGTHQALAACDAALIASGTATLEAALFKRPMVVAYKMAGLSYALMKGKAYLPWVALPNILAREFLVPEFLQHGASAEVLAKALAFQLDDHDNRVHLEQRFMDMHMVLRRDTASRSADAVGAFLAARGIN
jgi:lipid-A-disaccharide synthase